MSTQKELAEHLGLSDRRTRDLIKCGILPGSKGSGGYDVDACRAAYIIYLRGLSTGQVKAEADLNLDLERAKLVRVQRKKIELQNEVSEGKLLPADKVLDGWLKVVGAVRSRFLSLPNKTAPICYGAASIAEVEAILKSAVYEILTDVHDDIIKDIDTDC